MGKERTQVGVLTLIPSVTPVIFGIKMLAKGDEMRPRLPGWRGRVKKRETHLVHCEAAVELSNV